MPDKRLYAFFSYFGSKHRLAARYPEPRYPVIVEPFAGSAAYACRYWDRRVVLVEKNPKLCGVWRYLQRATPQEILALPLLEPWQRADELDVCQEAQWLIGWWVGAARASPCHVLSAWARESDSASTWGVKRRYRIASQLRCIRHWRIIEGDYTAAPRVDATWFVDPPYQVKGVGYPNGSADIDYGHPRDWCMNLRGQVVVCENEGARWLPFQPFATVPSNQPGRTSREAIWTRGC